MKTLINGALLTLLGLAAASTAQAQWATTDLILGFTGSSTGNDVLFDIGTPSSIGVGNSGMTTDIGSTVNFSLWNGGSYSSFGVVGYTGGTSAGIYSTVAPGFAPNTVGNKTAYNGINLTIQDTGSLIDGTGTPPNSAVVSISNPNSWSANMSNPGFNTFYNDYGSPNSTLSANSGVADLYFAKDDGSAPKLLGYFTMSGNDLTFTAANVPEPGTCALFAMSGLLALAFRRHLGRNS